MLTRGAPIPEVIWSSLESVLHANMYRLAKDIATTLRQPEAPLLQALKQSPIRPYIFEDSEDKEIDMRCDALCLKPSAPKFYQPCGQAILWGDGRRCAEHAYSIKTTYSLPKLWRLKDQEEPYFVSEDDTVYNTEYEAVGRYNRNSGLLTIFKVAG
jgi:hypothetical protein